MQYVSPLTVDDAVAALVTSQGSVQVLAGGTDLLVRLQAGHIQPDVLVDIKRIAACNTISQSDQGFTVGAAIPSANLSQHAAFNEAFPGVIEAMGLVGSTQIQGRATLVGNLCNASPAADSVPSMVAAQVSANIVGSKGNRQVPVELIPVAPGKTCLAKDELIVSLFFPTPLPRTGEAYLRFIPRTEMDIAVVGAAVSVVLDGQDQCAHARVALGAVAPTVMLVPTAAEILIGQAFTPNTLNSLQRLASQTARPISDKRATHEFRAHVIGVLTRRAAAIAYSRALAQV